ADYRDVETHNMYNERIALGFSHDDIMQSIYAKGRDNARTPMQWSSEPNAGFTTGEPWIKVNPNYTDINAENFDAPDSIYTYYRALIAFRKTLDIVTDGNFLLLYREDEEIFAYTRQLAEETLTVFCNFSAN